MRKTRRENRSRRIFRRPYQHSSPRIRTRDYSQLGGLPRLCPTAHGFRLPAFGYLSQDCVEARCPLELRDWWEGQLDVDNNLIYGYPHQFRQFSGDWGHGHDQVTETLAGLRTSPFGRRHVLTLWNPGEMAGITHANGNPRTPTTCHGTVMQFSVSPDKEGNPETLNMYHYQRSSDVLLGLPHNLVQYWALLTYFAHHSGLKVGRLVYQLGDAHLYAEESHLKVAIDIKRAEYPYYAHEEKSPVLTYQPSGEPDAPFIAADFNIAWPEGEQPDPPASTIRPKLL
jgi:thymidylate synthase